MSNTVIFTQIRAQGRRRPTDKKNNENNLKNLIFWGGSSLISITTNRDFYKISFPGGPGQFSLKNIQKKWRDKGVVGT